MAKKLEYRRRPLAFVLRETAEEGRRGDSGLAPRDEPPPGPQPAPRGHLRRPAVGGREGNRGREERGLCLNTGGSSPADFPSGEIFHVDADNLPQGGHEAIRRVLLRDEGGEVRTFLEVIRARNVEQGRNPTSRADLRFGTGPNGQFFLLNKHDGVIRLVVADG